MSTPGATTQVAAVMGSPVGHSLSPTLHNAAFREAGLDWVYVAFDVPVDRGAAAIDGARSLGLAGLSITMPLKEIAARSVDRLSPTAARLGAVNTVVREGEDLVGHNTDGGGLLDALGERGWQPRGRTCLILGAGGAARSVVLALAEAGAEEVIVVNRTRERAVTAAALAGSAGRVGSLDDVRRVELVVNATPMGMAGSRAADGRAIVAELRGNGQLVVDLVYHPVRTALLDGAEARGASVLSGVGMLVHQAARAFALWTGCPPPVEAMTAAAAAALDAAV